MNEQVLVNTISMMGQQYGQVSIDKNLAIAELNLLRQENQQLKQEIEELKRSSESPKETK